MRILVFGREGQVASELRKKEDVIALGRNDLCLTNTQGCFDTIIDIKPDVIINAAAYTSVDKAESEEETALKINGFAPRAMARAAADLNIPLIHISTDYVFSGSASKPWKPDDIAKPINAYGRTKLFGEEQIRSINCRHAIVRTSWIFSAHGTNFVKKMLELSGDRNEISVVADQIGGPTSAADVASCCLFLVRILLNEARSLGTLHYSGFPYVSWAEFAKEIFLQAGLPNKVVKIRSTDYTGQVRRPKNSKLDCADIKKIGVLLPQWDQSLSEVLKSIGNYHE